MIFSYIKDIFFKTHSICAVLHTFNTGQHYDPD